MNVGELDSKARVDLWVYGTILVFHELGLGKVHGLELTEDGDQLFHQLVDEGYSPTDSELSKRLNAHGKWKPPMEHTFAVFVMLREYRDDKEAFLSKHVK